MSTTEFDPEAVRASATILGNIMDDMAAFDELKAHWPNAGAFSTAQWLERIVDDRRNAVVEHAERLKRLLADVNVALDRLATDLEGADADNAALINAQLTTLRSTVGSDIASLGTGTEADQHNFSEAPDAPDGNGSDGDGYDDVLPGASSA
jgi:hypothetical protein